MHILSGNKSELGSKDQESIQSSTKPDPGYQWKVTNSQLDATNESQEVSPFPTGDHKAHMHTRSQRHSIHKIYKHKRSTKEVPPWNGQ